MSEVEKQEVGDGFVMFTLRKHGVAASLCYKGGEVSKLLLHSEKPREAMRPLSGETCPIFPDRCYADHSYLQAEHLHNDFQSGGMPALASALDTWCRSLLRREIVPSPEEEEAAARADAVMKLSQLIGQAGLRYLDDPEVAGMIYDAGWRKGGDDG